MKILLTALLLISNAHAAYLANGIKIGEISQTEATLWTRVTEHNKALNQDYKWNFSPRKDAPLPKLPFETPGTIGEVRISYWVEGDKETSVSLDWKPVTKELDYTSKATISELKPNTKYYVKFDVRSDKDDPSIESMTGSFQTAPIPTDEVNLSFNVIACQGFHRRDTADGHKIYTSMLSTKPAFLVHTGDVIYYDKPLPYAKDETLARYKWNRIYALPDLINFHKNVPCYFLRDDHDILKNDAWSGQEYGKLTFKRGSEIFKEQTTFPEKTPYRTVRWGKNVQLWFMEGREFRSPNNLKPVNKRTIWGAEQLAWLEKSLKNSDAPLKLILTPTPIVGPDRLKGKNDNHSNNSHKFEGDIVRTLLSSHDAISICGDRHWQYSSFDPTTKMLEFACGPASDVHSQGYSMKERKPNHKYLKICGGFLNVAIAKKDNNVSATIIHYSVDGKVNNTETITRRVK